MPGALGANSYTYNDFGALSTLTDGSGNVYRFTYKIGGQIDSLILGAGVKERRSYDLDGRLKFRIRSSTDPTVGFLVADSLFYDKSARISRVLEAARTLAAEQTLFSYDGLAAVVARESAIPSGSSDVQEFRNDAFGNVMRRLSRRSAGQVNDAPFSYSYGFNGALTSQNAQLNVPPDGIYQRQDDINQKFIASRLISQGELVRNPSSGDAELQVAAHHYYGSDDRLMAVERYSDRGELKDGTWEEYRYDALGRRIMTRVRRNGGSPYDNSSSLVPLCSDVNGSVNCRSYIERVWWDGDQSMLEMRLADGTADASNNAVMINIHALDLDEPIAVIAHWDNNATRIINYNWRGKGLSSVYVDGTGADNTTGASAVVDWPAATQSQTYFTPVLSTQDNTPRTWLGTFVQNGKGTTGMLYRRNRYFDTNTGRFTQEDPIGIAGGLNAYGFASGDPVNFSDPFGLCSPWPDCMFQGLANWGATRQGAVSSLALNVGAGLNAASEAFGTNDLGRAVGERDAVGATIALASMLPVGKMGRGAKLVDGLHLPVNKALDAAIEFLGKGYREVGDGRFLSADGLRQIRMGLDDILGRHAKGPHINFETLAPNAAKPGRNQIIENLHIYLIDK